MLKEKPSSKSSKTIAFHNFPHNDIGQPCGLPVYFVALHLSGYLRRLVQEVSFHEKVSLGGDNAAFIGMFRCRFLALTLSELSTEVLFHR